jgi:hypothetical protein
MRVLLVSVAKNCVRFFMENFVVGKNNGKKNQSKQKNVE